MQPLTPQAAGVMREGLAFISNINSIQEYFFPLPFLFRTCIRRPGCFPAACSSWHLEVVSLKIMNLCVRFFTFCYVLPCERA